MKTSGSAPSAATSRTVRDVTDVHYLQRPRLVHQLVSRAGKEYTARCGVVTEDASIMSGWHQFITCEGCLNGGSFVEMTADLP